jgi:hypothetical protein
MMSIKHLTRMRKQRAPCFFMSSATLLTSYPTTSVIRITFVIPFPPSFVAAANAHDILPFPTLLILYDRQWHLVSKRTGTD